MSFLIGLLTVVLVLDCVLLILLVLIQLPKKEAGAGIAFGGSAADALFGAGSGNVLTKATKYGTVAFFVLLLVLGSLQMRTYQKATKEVEQKLEEQAKSGGLPMSPTTYPSTPAATPAASNIAAPPVLITNLPEAPAAPAPAPAPQK